MTKISLHCLVDTPWYCLSVCWIKDKNKRPMSSSLFCHLPLFFTFFRVGATRNAPDSRGHGHKILSFSTTLISSKIISFLSLDFFFLHALWIAESESL